MSKLRAGRAEGPIPVRTKDLCFSKTSRPTLVAHPSPYAMGTGVPSLKKSYCVLQFIIHLRLAPGLRMSGVIRLFPLRTFTSLTEKTLHLPLTNDNKVITKNQKNAGIKWCNESKICYWFLKLDDLSKVCVTQSLIRIISLIIMDEKKRPWDETRSFSWKDGKKTKKHILSDDHRSCRWLSNVRPPGWQKRNAIHST